MAEPIPCLIRTLAPLHLGADEVFEPLGFVIDENAHPPCLVAFEPWSFLARLPERDRRQFMDLCRQGTVASLLEIYRFYHERRRQAQGRAVPVCPGLVGHYQNVMKARDGDRDLQKTISQFTIHRTAFLAHDQRPYIPGSAIKGALRTAYLNALAASKSHVKSNPHDKGAAGRLERELLEGSFANDPFRLVKVSDFLPVGDIRTRIVYAVYEKKDRSVAREIYQILEVIDPGAMFLGRINVEALTPEERRLAGIGAPLAKETLWETARHFYSRERLREEKDLAAMKIPLSPLGIAGDAAPLRLGRHSGSECVTIDGHRHIRISRPGVKPPRFGPSPTTLWFAADYYLKRDLPKAHLRPMGWAALGELSPAELDDLQAREEAWQGQVRAATPVVAVSQPASAADEKHTAPPPPVQAPPEREVWEGATLTWEGGRQQLNAAWQGKRAFCRGLELAPPELQAALTAKKKSKGVTAKVTVEALGTAWRIVAVEKIS